MSVTKQVTIWCDGPGINGAETCFAWEYGDSGVNDATFVRRDLRKRLGWRRTRDGHDLCPDCVRKSRERKERTDG